jgi:metallo-beta-lactamase family protein
MDPKKLKLTFCGGTGSVTGANFLLESEDKKFLIDCGLTQSSKLADDANWEPFLYDPKEIDILFVTHAHIDHVGRIPKLIHEGFKGRIISTIPTKDIAALMIEDTVHILGKNEEHDLGEIYTEENLKKTLLLWETIDYHQHLNIDHGFQFFFQDAGHILGSAMLNVIYNGKKIVFTGDLGNSPSPLLCDTEKVTDADYLIMESVYGDRNHEDRDERRQIFEHIIQDNVKRRGALILPTFSLERSQELLYELGMLFEAGRIPLVPVFLDSPLAIRLTDVYQKYTRYFNADVKKMIETDSDIFMFPGLTSTIDTEQSKMIPRTPNPKIIIAGSGMSSGGRIVHHEKTYLPDSSSTLLLTGYQSLGTMGRMIEDGAKSVRINGEQVTVRAHVAKISGYSGHKDSDHLLDFVGDMQDQVKKIFVVMGEPKSALFLVQKLRDTLGIDASAPNLGDSVDLMC